VAEQSDAKVVTVDEGSGPVKVVKDPGGRILSREQMALVRDKQQADLDQVAQLRDKLAANDAAATADMLGQFKDRLSLQLAMLDRQKGQMQDTLAKLEANDTKTVSTVLGQMVQRLSRQAEGMAKARDRSAALLAELDATAGTQPAGST
jgi:hypothetical protein